MSLDQAIRVPVADGAMVVGDLTLPASADRLVVFAHGSGSGRHSPRNRMVADAFAERGLGTLLMDLLTVDEERVDQRTHHLRFDIDLLATRLVAAANWLAEQPTMRGLSVGYFGASTGAAAALVAAARRPAGIGAVVSRGGRPDLAEAWLADVRAPTLLVVGALDVEVLELNRRAGERLRVEHDLEVVPGATHLFEEPGALERVGQLAGEWFLGHPPRPP
jgi:dienelactone hydrolase